MNEAIDLAVPAPGSRSRRWFVTVNYAGHTDQWCALECERLKDEFKKLFEAPSDEQILRYACFVLEQGGEGNTFHTHSVLHFNKSMRFNKIKKWVSDLYNKAGNIQQQRGANEQARKYIFKKDETYRLGPWEYGILKCEKGASALKRGVQLLVDGKASLRELAGEQPYSFVRSHSGFGALAEMLTPPLAVPDRTVSWYWGPSGTGKTYSAWKDAIAAAGGEEDRVVAIGFSQGGMTGFRPDEYDPRFHRAVILDELRASSIDYSLLLRLLDVYPFSVDARYRKKAWNVKHIYVTSPFPPSHFSGQEEALQLERRLTTVRHLTVPYEAAGTGGGGGPGSQGMAGGANAVGQ